MKGDHIQVTLRGCESHAIIVNTLNQPHKATIIIMKCRGHLKRMPLGELAHYDVIFNQVAFYKGGHRYVRCRYPSLWALASIVSNKWSPNLLCVDVCR